MLRAAPSCGLPGSATLRTSFEYFDERRSDRAPARSSSPSAGNHTSAPVDHEQRPANAGPSPALTNALPCFMKWIQKPSYVRHLPPREGDRPSAAISIGGCSALQQHQ